MFIRRVFGKLEQNNEAPINDDDIKTWRVQGSCVQTFFLVLSFLDLAFTKGTREQEVLKMLSDFSTTKRHHCDTVLYP